MDNIENKPMVDYFCGQRTPISIEEEFGVLVVVYVVTDEDRKNFPQLHAVSTVTFEQPISWKG